MTDPRSVFCLRYDAYSFDSHVSPKILYSGSNAKILYVKNDLKHLSLKKMTENFSKTNFLFEITFYLPKTKVTCIVYLRTKRGLTNNSLNMEAAFLYVSSL